MTAKFFLDALTRQGIEEDLKDAVEQYLQWALQDELLEDFDEFIRGLVEDFEADQA